MGAPIASSQQIPSAHRSSVPVNLYQGRHQPDGHSQQRSFSLLPTPFHHGSLTPASSEAFCWDNVRTTYFPHGLSNVSSTQQQFGQELEEAQRTGGLENIVGEVTNVIGEHASSDDAPWTSLNSQQYGLQHFSIEQFQGSRSGALTVVPDTRSQNRDSAYWSESSHRRSAPSEEHHHGFVLASQPYTVHQQTAGNRSPRSAVSDTQLHKNPKRSPAIKKIICSEPGCGKDDLKNFSDLK